MRRWGGIFDVAKLRARLIELERVMAGPGFWDDQNKARATLDAMLAKWAAPGMCNPDDDTPCVDEQPDTETAERDSRTQRQRSHDALKACLRAMLASANSANTTACPPPSSSPPPSKNSNPVPGTPSPAGARCCRCAM